MEKANALNKKIVKMEDPMEIIAFRFHQSRNSRLAEYIIGLRPDDPKMPDRLVADQAFLRSKYDLKDRRIRMHSPYEQERFLRHRAEELGVVIRERSECGNFFDKHSANAVYFDDDKKIGLSINRGDLFIYDKNLGSLEHEFVHVNQFKDAPMMPIEQMEYEASVATLSMKSFRRPRDIELHLFGRIDTSVVFWYKQLNEDKKESQPKEVPIWDDPEYFLKHVDKVDPKLIEEYKKVTLSRDNQ